MRLMKPGVELYQNLRQLVIDKRAPEFYDESEVPFKLSSKFFIELNESQRNVIRKVVYSKDYALVLGMPGGGKTTVIAHIIKQLAFSGKSVLVASYTHTAVDNILLKLIELGVDFLRVGSTDNVHPSISKFTSQSLRESLCTRIEQLRVITRLKHLYKTKSVVASTCFGINHPLLMMRTFDYCIIDEASQITLPTILGPLLCSRKFVLVGDHNQLPPLVKCSKAALMGLQETLFKILTQAHPRSMTELVYQYRMNSDISLISSHLIYDYRLKCATPSTAAKHLVLKIPVSFAKNEWITPILDSTRSVIFLNTDKISDNLESFNACGILNVFESKLASFLALALIKCGVSAGNVGIITPYHSQTLLIKENLIKSEFLSTLEVFTIDKYQGKDKLVIILSFVRSNSLSLVGSLLEDSRRLNVAFTRAKEKFIMMGSKKTLQSSLLLSKFFDLAKNKNWIYDLPEDVETEIR
ncbi:DNA replication ATP-dependent helicase/nuclease DNA2-like [Zophobas morio]|uniref:DNA replication ATP-dependent helicase/nuclease DNA2-like n=1 Tax=Zophobas morio TaxID=2755281 RepID=UPI003083DCC6